MSRLLESIHDQPMSAIRLSISRLKTGWAVISEHKIDKMVMPAHHEIPKLSRDQALAGSWFEVRDQNDQLIYRRRFNLPNLMETHDEKAGIARETVADELLDPIQIIIPDIEQTSRILLFSTVDHSRGRQIHPRNSKKPVPFAVFKRAN